MKNAAKIRCGLIGNGAAAMSLMVGVVLSAQTPQGGAVKPSAAVSTLPAAQTTDVAGKDAPAPVAAAPHHVEVEYADGKLAVQATNASLNEILREVGKKTGMKITGGVADDKVFGDYGPSTPSVVLDALLEGTGTNILLVDDVKGGSELILTPRRGGASPPNPNAARARESEDNGEGNYVAPVRAYQPPSQTGRGPGAVPPDLQISQPGSDAADGSGPKTPQQIYDQLQQKMQQQRQAGGSNDPTALPQQQ